MLMYVWHVFSVFDHVSHMYFWWEFDECLTCIWRKIRVYVAYEVCLIGVCLACLWESCECMIGIVFG